LDKAAVVTGSGPDEIVITEELKKYFSANTSMQGIVLDIPPDFKGKNEKDFYVRISQVIAMMGSALPLPSGRVLAIFPAAADRELIAHRLEKSLNTKALVVFAAESSAKALEYIEPYR
jgi:hypothetical protein